MGENEQMNTNCNTFVNPSVSAAYERPEDHVYLSDKHLLALSTALTLVETKHHSVTRRRVLSWRRPALYDWLESRWGLHWTGEAWL